jgi:excisionase family DNA binding protein
MISARKSQPARCAPAQGAPPPSPPQSPPQAAIAPRAVGRKEAAKALGLSLATVDRAISRGDLVAKKYGTRTLVPVVEIERYLARLEDKEKPPAT